MTSIMFNTISIKKKFGSNFEIVKITFCRVQNHSIYVLNNPKSNFNGMKITLKV